MLKVYDLDMNYVTTLKNAYQVSYSKEENQIWDASFFMPYGDPQLKYLKPLRFVEIFDRFNERIGLFRVWPSERKKSIQARRIKIELLDVLHTLTDSVLFGYHQLSNYKTDYVMRWLLDQQKQKRWEFGSCEFSRGFSYAWENENGLASALFSIPKPFDEDWVIERDTTVYPWKLHLKRPETEVTARIVEGYNLKDITIKESPEKIVNRVYALGDGEGVNQLTFKSINSGKAYVEDKASQEEFGLIEYIWVDRRFKDKASQKSSAESMLRKWKNQQMTMEISAVDLTKIINRPANLKASRLANPITANQLRLGKVIEIQLKDDGVFRFRILKEKKMDIDGDPGEIQLTLGSISGNSNTTIADIKRQQEINTTYANGATNIIPYVFDREADSTHPVSFKFFVDDDVINVNTCELTLETTKFRATSKANKSVDTVVQTATSSAGGGTVSSSTTSAGGGSVQSTTSGAGGGATTSSGGAGNVRLKLFDVAEGPINPNWGEGLCVGADGWGLAIKTGYIGSFYSNGTTGNHTHSVNIPSHSHNVSINIPSHTHSVSMNIPSHTHSVSITIPGHTHEIIYGIFEYSGTPNKLEIKVDGNLIDITDTNFERFDIVPYLKKGSDGRVQRGRHTLEIKPNDLARIEVQLVLRVFIQSQLGGEF